MDNKGVKSTWGWKVKIIRCTVASATNPFGSVRRRRIITCIIVNHLMKALREKVSPSARGIVHSSVHYGR